mmetsp:Transcript_47614/g.119066  ORF Transcript_47614/g.119066 Transcript_47614/m.119066 type:complete len:177 (-) Transcript_47614:77-607(-)
MAGWELFIRVCVLAVCSVCVCLRVSMSVSVRRLQELVGREEGRYALRECRGPTFILLQYECCGITCMAMRQSLADRWGLGDSFVWVSLSLCVCVCPCVRVLAACVCVSGRSSVHLCVGRCVHVMRKQAKLLAVSQSVIFARHPLAHTALPMHAPTAGRVGWTDGRKMHMYVCRYTY